MISGAVATHRSIVLTWLIIILTLAGLVVHWAGVLVSSLRNPVLDVLPVILLVACFVVVMMLGVTIHCSLSALGVRREPRPARCSGGGTRLGRTPLHTTPAAARSRRRGGSAARRVRPVAAQTGRCGTNRARGQARWFGVGLWLRNVEGSADVSPEAAFGKSARITRIAAGGGDPRSKKVLIAGCSWSYPPTMRERLA